MPRLIHLNGLSRVGKSTMARRYATEHAGVLDLDVDVLVGLVGGWREDFPSAFAVAREHAKLLGVSHLAQGHDVVLPQLITTFDPRPWADDIAAAAGADYVEVALLAGSEVARDRVAGKHPEHEVDAHIQRAITASDGVLLDRIAGHFEAYLADRPYTIRIDTTELGPDETYARFLSALGES